MSEHQQPGDLIGQERSTVQQSEFSGPLPPAPMFALYDETVPGAADRILAMSEKEQGHRITWENKALEHEARSERRGQWMAFALALAGITGVIACSAFDQTAASVILGISTISGLVGRFLNKN